MFLESRLPLHRWQPPPLEMMAYMPPPPPINRAKLKRGEDVVSGVVIRSIRGVGGMTVQEGLVSFGMKAPGGGGGHSL